METKALLCLVSLAESILNIGYFGKRFLVTGVWLPLTSRVYERLLTGSEFKWGNLAAHKFELQTLVAPRGNRFWQSVFWVRNILPRGLIGLLMKMAKKI